MARHLSGDELIDLAEGARALDTAPHLDACESCRDELAGLRAAMSAATEVSVPEPSPLFWDHLSARVRAAVSQEGWPDRESRGSLGSLGSLSGSWTRLMFPIAAGALVAVLIALLITVSGVAPSSPAGTSSALSPATFGAEPLSDDPPLGLVADLTADMDWDTARDAGLTSEGSADHAVTHLSEGELRQLHRLLQKELGQPGA